MENWRTAELLPKINVSLNLLNDIKTYSAEQLFDNLKIYYGDDPDKYNISFEALLGIYCSTIESVDFFHTPIAIAANVIRFDDLHRMSLGKILFFIEIPRVATGNDVTATKQTTVMVTKHTEKYPINISFELSAACLNHLEETFKKTILDQILNINAMNTVLRALKNSADALERGLVHAFVRTLLRKAPPHFMVKTVIENKVGTRQTLSRVQRSNMFQTFKSRFLQSLFFLNRTNNTQYIYRLLCEFVESVTDSILNNTNTYVADNGVNLNGVMIGTPTAVQTLLTTVSQHVVKRQVSIPVSFGQFVMGKENAVTAIAYRSIMSDFKAYVDRVATSEQDTLDKPEFFEKNQTQSQMQMNVLQLGDRFVILDHLNKIYKNTTTQDPLEREMEITFYFPLGLYIPDETAFSTMDNKVKLNNTMENNLPTNVFFHNKDNVLQKVDYLDLLKILCHPAANDATISKRIFDNRPHPTGDLFQKLCLVEFVKEIPGRILDRWLEVYVAQQEVPKTTNMLKNELSITDFYKPDNVTLFTELHPQFDFTFVQNGRNTETLCTPRILLGNMPLPLAPPSFHELRAMQIAEQTKSMTSAYDLTIRAVVDSLNGGCYPELAYVLEILIHGNRMAFRILKNVVSRCITFWFTAKHTLLFCNSFEMVTLIATHLNDDEIPTAAYNHYKNLVSIVRLVKRTISVSNANGNLCGEPLANYVNGLFDGRLFCPFLHTMPRNDVNVAIVANVAPLTANTVRMRNYEVSDLERMDLIDSHEVFTDNDRPSLETTVLSKIFYFCVLPALTNNKMCGAGVNLKDLVLDLFYDEAFVATDEGFASNPITNQILLDLIREALGSQYDAPDIARSMFRSLCYITENTRIFQIQGTLDPAQRHGNSADFESLQHVLYNGICLITPIQLLRTYFVAIPFHRFFSDPTICGAMHADVQLYLNNFPQYQRNDGGFPLPYPFAHEYHNWHRTPFSVYSASCQNSLLSILTLACMHSKLSAVSTAVQSRHKYHPGVAVTLVRTDSFDVDYLLYSSKSATSILLNEPTVTREERDISSLYNLTQHINFIDMGLGYSSTTSAACLKRIKTDMGARIQDLFEVFPMHAFTNTEVNAWIRNFIGIERTFNDTEAFNMLTFGSVGNKPNSTLLHGQQAICEGIITPVTANVNFFKTANNPRGRASSMMGTDPYNDTVALKALYDHTQTDSHSFAATVNPWASLEGSLGDVMFNVRHRDQLGYNPKSYSPCEQFFTTDEILKSNRLMFKTIDEYCARATTCIDGDAETQYSCVDGTDNIVRRPCRFLQEAFPIHSSSNQALLESRIKNGTAETSETHFCNFAIGEIIPLQTIITRSSL